MVDTPFLNDGADESLRKTVSLLNKIEAKTGATTITGPVTVSNEVEVTNSSGSPIPVSGTVTANTGLTQPLTNTELRLTAVPVSLASVPSHAVTGPLTDAQLRNTAVPVSGSVSVSILSEMSSDEGGAQPDMAIQLGFSTETEEGEDYVRVAPSNPLPISGTVTANTGLTQPLTDTQLRATAVPVSLASVPSHAVTGPLTDTQLRAAVVPVSLASVPSHPVTGTFFQATQPVSLASVPSHAVTGPLTNTELRLTAVPVSGTFFQGTQPVSLASAPVTPVTDNGGSLTVDGTVTVNDMTSGNAKTKIVDSVGADVSYITAGTAGTPSASVLSVQGISGGVSVTTTPQQGTTVASTTFTSTTASSSVIAASATRKGLTVYNAGFGDLYICAGVTCTTTSFQLKLVSGDYWECPPAQVTLAHAGVYATAGTAYVTTIT